MAQCMLTHSFSVQLFVGRSPSEYCVISYTKIRTKCFR